MMGHGAIAAVLLCQVCACLAAACTPPPLQLSALLGTSFGPQHGGVGVFRAARRGALTQPLLSVLTSFVGADEERWLSGYLADVAAQTLFDRSEVLIGVTPEHLCALKPASAVALHDFVLRTPRAALAVFQQDPGLYGVWNFLIENVAAAPFLTNANMDDRRRRDAWEYKVQHLLHDGEVGVVATPAYVVQSVTSWEEFERQGGDKEVWFQNLSNKPLISLHDLFVDRGYGLMAQNFVHNAPVWRASLHASVGMFDLDWVPFSDFQFWLRCRQRKAVFHMLREVVELYYLNPSSYNRRQGAAEVEQEVAARLHVSFIGEVPAPWKCLPRRLLLLHDALSLSGIISPADYRVLFLATQLGSITCAPLVVGLFEAGEVGSLNTALEGLNVQFVDASGGLEAGPVGNFYLTLMSAQLQEGVPSIPEAMLRVPPLQRLAYGGLVALPLDAVSRADAFAPGSKVAERRLAAFANMSAVLTPTRWEAAQLQAALGARLGASAALPTLCTLPYGLLGSPPAPESVEPGQLCFLGAGGRESEAAMEWVLSQVWPLLGASAAQFTLHVAPTEVGTAAGEQLCGQQDSACSTEVPSTCWAYIAPVLGDGYSLHASMMHALSHGAPVVTTQLGGADFRCNPACGGLHAAHTPGDAAAALLQWLHDGAAYRESAAAAVAYFDRWDTQALPGCLVELLEGVVK